MFCGEQLQQLIAKGQDAARLDADDRDVTLNIRPKHTYDFHKPLSCLVQHSLVIQRTPAADVLWRNAYAEASALQHPDSGNSRIRLEEVGEGIGEEQHFVSATVNVALAEPVAE